MEPVIERPALFSGQGLISSLITVFQQYGRAINGLLTPFFATAAEQAASVRIYAWWYLPGDFRRYKSLVDGDDDGPSVRAAILQSLESGGALPVGQPGATYLCSTWTAVSTTAAIRLYGSGYTLKGPVSYTDFCRPGGTVDVSGIKFERWLSMFERQAANGGSIVGFRVRRCEFTDFTSLPINIEIPIRNYWITDNYFHDGACGDCIRIGRNVQAEQSGWRDGHVLRNTFRDIEIDPTGEGGAIIVYGSDVEIVGNFGDGINNEGALGVECWFIYTKAIGAKVANNTGRNITAPNGSAWVFNIKGQVHGETSSPQGYNVVLSNNHAFGAVGGANGGYGFRLQSSGILAENCIAEDCGGSGFSVDYSEAGIAGYVTSLRGCVARFTTSTGTVAFRISTGLSMVKLSQCFAYNAEIGIRAASINGTESDWDFSDCTLYIAVGGQGVVIRRDADLTNVTLSYITVRGIGGAPAAGVRYETGAGTLDSVREFDCDFADATTPTSGTLPTNYSTR